MMAEQSSDADSLSGQASWQTWLRRLATPLAAAIFLIVGISGTLMFFDVAKQFLQDMHGWLGLLFVAAAALHMLRNARGFVRVIRQRATHLFVVASLVLATLMLLTPDDEDGAPFAPLIDVATNAPLEKLAPLLGSSAEILVERLQAGGVAGAAPNLSLKQIEASGHVPLPRLMALILPRRPD